MLPARSNARRPVLPAALKKPPSKPTPSWSVSNHTDIGPLNVGVPERTGDVGLEPSPVMNTSGDNGSSVSGPVMLPTTQALAAPPGQLTPRVALRLSPRTQQIGRAHVYTPVSNAHLVFRLLLKKKKK